jgi:leucyl aminopeptidase (aminopeptidase T)
MAMNIGIGTETRDEFYGIELGAAAQKLVTVVRPTKPGQQVLITADTASDARVVWATAQAVYAAGGIPTIVWSPKQPLPMQEPPGPVAGAALRADIWIDYAVSYQLYSPAWKTVMEGNCVYVCLTAMDVDMMVRTIGRVDYDAMQRMGRRLYELSQAASVVRVTNPAGTDLCLSVNHKIYYPPWQVEGRKSFAQMLGGQSWFHVLREHGEGVLVFDGVIWPPEELGLLHTPVRLVIEGGYIRKVEGEAEAHIFDRWLKSFNHPAVYLIDHACYGFNPGVRKPSGRILEDERVFGCMQFGIGATPKEYGSPTHTDGVCLNASVWLDDVQIADSGHYILPELVELCRAMGVTGY